MKVDNIEEIDWEILDQEIFNEPSYAPKENYREKLREKIATKIFWLIVGIILTAIIMFSLNIMNFDQLKDFLTIALSPLFTFFGVIVGFFYATEAK